MLSCCRRMVPPILLALACMALSGCDQWRKGGMAAWMASDASDFQHREMVAYREKFQTDRDHDSLQWLLKNGIETGMSLDEVSAVLGNSGERVYGDKWMRSDDTHYRAHDVAYRWGPDDMGNSIYLVFREDRLLSFDTGSFE